MKSNDRFCPLLSFYPESLNRLIRPERRGIKGKEKIRNFFCCSYSLWKNRKNLLRNTRVTCNVAACYSCKNKSSNFHQLRLLLLSKYISLADKNDPVTMEVLNDRQLQWFRSSFNIYSSLRISFILNHSRKYWT